MSESTDFSPGAITRRDLTIPDAQKIRDFYLVGAVAAFYSPTTGHA